MSDRAGGNEVRAGFRVGSDGIESDIAGKFDRGATAMYAIHSRGFRRCRLSSSRCMRPAAALRPVPSRVRTSISIGECGIPRAFKRGRTPPAAAMWLFLIRIAS